MRTAIIAAMEEEVAYLKQHINNYEIYEFQGYKYHIGEIHDAQVVLLQSGIGKVNAAVSTTILFEHFKVAEVINTGSAGAIDSNFAIGDVIIADACVYHDVDVTPAGYAYGQIPAMPIKYLSDTTLVKKISDILVSFDFNFKIGTITTGDMFVTTPTQIAKILQEIPDIKAVEMEATAITQVCYQYQLPFVVVRSISDIVGNNSNNEFETYLDIASRHTTDVIVEYLKTK